MQNGKSLHVVVVGAGIVGASIAYHLARRQVAVTVLERHRPGAGASSHSFAWINAFGKEPYPITISIGVRWRCGIALPRDYRQT